MDVQRLSTYPLATAPSPGRPTPGVVKQDTSSGGSFDTTKTRSGPQRVGMCSGERPIGAAKGKQSDTKALCQPPPPLSNAPAYVVHHPPVRCGSAGRHAMRLLHPPAPLFTAQFKHGGFVTWLYSGPSSYRGGPNSYQDSPDSYRKRWPKCLLKWPKIPTEMAQMPTKIVDDPNSYRDSPNSYQDSPNSHPDGPG